MSEPAASAHPKPTYVLTRQIFIRSLGAIYLFAFTSLYTQIDGLIGSEGILPVHDFLPMVQSIVDSHRFWLVPTLCWINSSDTFLHILCICGIALSLLVLIGIAQLPSLILLYAGYLSLCSAGQIFLGYQWDALLLEAGFLAIFFAPLHPLAWRSNAAPPQIVLWLLRFLLFRLMFMSGYTKLSSGDPTWHSLTALQYHYLTQPLPTWTSWYFYQLPSWFQTLSCLTVFFSELVIPVLIFTPRITRLIAFWGIIAFQLLIAGTGNYGFFNLLTIVLCFTLPDDRFWRALIRRKQPDAASPSVPRWRRYAFIPLAAFVLSLIIPILLDDFTAGVEWPAPIDLYRARCAPFCIANEYGLFRVMTTEYRDIVVEGSNDGQTWKAYEFKYKPQDLDRRPQFTTPHMPRLDWQMWFASLGDVSQNEWFTLFVDRLLSGSKPVLDLLNSNPFPHHPPKYIRATLYQYKFTDLPTRRATGDWWTRSDIGTYYEATNRKTEY
jgi:hypothetical protein